MGRRRSRGALATLVAIAVLLAVAVGLDALARTVVERQAAQALQQDLGTSQPLSVSIGGWPFSLALITGTARTVTVMAPQLTLSRNGQKVTVSDAEAVATSVHDVRRPADAVAGTLRVAATVSWAEVSRLAGVTISSAGGDRARFTDTISLLGADVAVTISAVPAIDPATHSLVLGDPRASVAGVQIPASALASVTGSLASKIDLPAPVGLAYDSVQASTAGMRVALSGADVRLTALG